MREWISGSMEEEQNLSLFKLLFTNEEMQRDGGIRSSSIDMKNHPLCWFKSEWAPYTHVWLLGPQLSELYGTD